MEGLFDDARLSRADSDKLAAKAKTVKAGRARTRKGPSMLDRIKTAEALTASKLGHLENELDLVTTKKAFNALIDACIEQDVAALDTETSGLDPLEDRICGICLATRGHKPAYAPFGHLSFVTQQLRKGNLPEELVKSGIQRLLDEGVPILMHNAKFDMKMLKVTFGMDFPPVWDTLIAARVLDENRWNNDLKHLHNDYCGGTGSPVSFKDLYKGISFQYVDPKVGYLYAAHDAGMTIDLYDYQLEELEKKENAGLLDLLDYVEFPCTPAVAAMELNGVKLDVDYATELEEKYEARLEERRTLFNELCEEYAGEIEAYRVKMGDKCKLATPILISSPPQLKILLYDILEMQPWKSPTTDADTLAAINNDLARSILAFRETHKLLGTYVKGQKKRLGKDGRIHTSLNQYGAVTGRFSSSDPNLQNIPSHNRDIRPMFVASDGYLMISSDYAAQEPRLTSHMSQDERMIAAYVAGEDLYVTIASIIFDKPYEECQEFREDGTMNPEGLERRAIAKKMVLAVCYGMSVASVAVELHIDKSHAQRIFDRIMTEFPGLKDFMDGSQQMARDIGYVDTVWGRRRRLPDMQLPWYEFTMKGVPDGFDPLDFEADDVAQGGVPEAVKKQWIAKLDKAYGHAQRNKVIEAAKRKGIAIKSNGGRIAAASRQAVNARIQGSAADMIKKALILLHNDKRLQELDFRLLITVHDEIIGEAPREHAKEAGERLAALMVEAASDLDVPSRCDVTTTERWYGEVIAA